MAFDNPARNVFIFRSKPGFLDLSTMPIKTYQKIEFNSDIRVLFSYGEVFWRDSLGIIADKINFIQGLPIHIEYGDSEDISNRFINDYIWSEHQILKTELGNHIIGTNLFTLLTDKAIKNVLKSRAFIKKTISEVVKEVIKDFDLTADNKKVFVSDTEGTSDWYQLNETNYEFLKRLADMAYSSNASKSPFVTFFNNIGEFYFCSMSDLFKKEVVDTYKIQLNSESVHNPFNIKSFDIVAAGFPVNKPDYKKESFFIKDTGAYQKTEEKITDHLVKEDKQVFLILKDNISTTTEVIFSGIAETVDEEKIIKGIVNETYFDSNISYQMWINIVANPKISAGKVIKLEIESSFEDKQIAEEYSGKWLVIRDENRISTSSGQVHSKLYLTRSGMFIDNDHPFKDKFVN